MTVNIKWPVVAASNDFGLVASPADVDTGDSVQVESVTGGKKGLRVARYDLIPPEVLTALAEHYGRNCFDHGGKYTARNWEKGYPWAWSYRALQGHLCSFWKGEDVDQDSPSLHITAALWHCVALLYYSLHPKLYAQFDDRSKKGG